MKKIQKNTSRFENRKEDFLDEKKYSGTAEATLKGYQYDITRFLDFLTGEQLPVNEAGFKRDVVHLTDSGMSANSINHHIRSGNMFLYGRTEGKGRGREAMLPRETFKRQGDGAQGP